jgi:hypothetical protein
LRAGRGPFFVLRPAWGDKSPKCHETLKPPGQRPRGGLVFGDRVVPQPPAVEQPNRFFRALEWAVTRRICQKSDLLETIPPVGTAPLTGTAPRTGPTGPTRPRHIAPRTSAARSGTNSAQPSDSRGVRASGPGGRHISCAPLRFEGGELTFVRPRSPPRPHLGTHTRRGTPRPGLARRSVTGTCTGSQTGGPMSEMGDRA